MVILYSADLIFQKKDNENRKQIRNSINNIQ